jgi:predicted ATPase/transcriptional regulator with XRE-family HTH domain
MDASFGYWLRRRRKALDLTQEALAERVGCSAATIRKIEGDERRPSRQIAEILAEVLAVEPQDRRLFLQAARGECRTERLAAIAAPASAGLPLARSAALTSKPCLPPPASHATPLTPTLPTPLTPLIGRSAELAELHHLLTRPECRLLSVVGPGGIGKTRLVLAAAQAIVDLGLQLEDWSEAAQRAAINQQSTSRKPHFKGGVAFVAFASLSSSEHMLPAIANALGLAFTGTLAPKTQLLTYLRDKEMLLVLDNLEHLLGGIGLLVDILEQTSEVTLLVTSRERLNLQGEWVFELQGLPTPPTPITPPQFREGLGVGGEVHSSIKLFVESAQRVRMGFTLTEQNYAAVARICRLVAGMPLGIELAAAWAPVLSCGEIADEIGRTIDFLAVSRRDMPERHRSLRAAFDHSWQLLTTEERRVMRRLSVFRGGCTREAAGQVAGATLPVLAMLVAKSLLQRTAPGRYELHELVRQYAAAKLVEEAQSEGLPTAVFDAYRAHAGYFLNLALTAEPHLGGSAQVQWLDRLEEEHNNLRAALDWTLDAGAYDVGLQLATALMWFWSQRDHKREGYLHLMKQLAQSAAAPSLARIRALSAASYLAFEENDALAARTLLDEALQISSLLQQDKVALAATLHSAARVAILQADYAAARSFIEQNLALAQELGHQHDMDALLIGLGDVTLLQGDLAQAQTVYAEKIRLLRQSRNVNLLAYALRQLSKVMLRLGDPEQAGRLCRESLALNQETQSQQGVIACLAGLAAVLAAQGQTGGAVQLFGAVEAFLATLAVPLLPIDRIEYERQVTALRQQLHPAAWATAWAEGRAMTLEQAIKVALVAD